MSSGQSLVLISHFTRVVLPSSKTSMAVPMQDMLEKSQQTGVGRGRGILGLGVARCDPPPWQAPQQSERPIPTLVLPRSPPEPSQVRVPVLALIPAQSTDRTQVRKVAPARTRVVRRRPRIRYYSRPGKFTREAFAACMAAMHQHRMGLEAGPIQ